MALWNKRTQPLIRFPHRRRVVIRVHDRRSQLCLRHRRLCAAAAAEASHRAKDRTEALKESALAAELTIEGKISGNAAFGLPAASRVTCQ